MTVIPFPLSTRIVVCSAFLSKKIIDTTISLPPSKDIVIVVVPLSSLPLNPQNSKLFQIDPELLGSQINIPPVLIHRLHPLRADPQLDLPPKCRARVLLDLEVHVLDLLVTLVGECDHPGLAVGRLSEEVAVAGAV